MTNFDDVPLHIDFGCREVTVDEKLVDLTSNEYKLLTTLVRHRGETLSFERIVELTSEDRGGLGAPRRAKNACVLLHRKLGLEHDVLWDGPIEHVPGVGYRYGSCR